MDWISRNFRHVATIATSVTVLTAMAAVLGIVLQLWASDEIARAQSARDAYAAHLVLAVENPDLAAPAQTCDLLASDRGAAYRAFVDHLLFSAEQMISSAEGWDDTFEAALLQHRDYVCHASGLVGESPVSQRLVDEFRKTYCMGVAPCPASY